MRRGLSDGDEPGNLEEGGPYPRIASQPRAVACSREEARREKREGAHLPAVFRETVSRARRSNHTRKR